jgi:Inverse autotransporter, beta-domain
MTMKRLGLLTLLFSTALVARPETLPHEFWQPYIDVTGRTDGYRRGEGMALWTPICESECSLFFGQVGWGRWYDTWSGSAGLGFRHLANWAWGVNGFVDYSRSNHGHGFLQVGLGGELLGDCFEARINGYYPFSNERRVPNHCTKGVVSEQLELGLQLMQDESVWKRWESAYRGFDLEVGAGMPLTCNSSGWAYIGYKQLHTHHDRDIIGPRVRAEFRLDNFLGLCGAQGILGGFYEYDRLFHHEGGVELGIRIPLTGPARSNRDNPSCLYRRMGNRVIRAESVLVHRRDERCFQQVNGLGKALFMSPSGREGAVGSQADPAPVGTDGSEFDLLLLVGGEGKMPERHELVSTLELRENQRLYGVGKELDIEFDEVKWNLSSEGRPVILQAPEGGAAVRLAPGATVEGLTIAMKKKATAIAGEAAHEVTLRNLQVDGQGDGIVLSDSTDVTLEDIRLPKAQHGIELRGETSGSAKKVTSKDVAVALALEDASGAFEVTELLFDAKGGTPLQVHGGSPDLKVSGTVRDSGNFLLHVDGMRGGEVLFTHVSGGSRPIYKDEVWTSQGTYGLNNKAEGIYVNNSDGKVTVIGALLGGEDPIIVQGGSAQLQVVDSKITKPVKQTSNLILENCQLADEAKDGENDSKS